MRPTTKGLEVMMQLGGRPRMSHEMDALAYSTKYKPSEKSVAYYAKVFEAIWKKANPGTPSPWDKIGEGP